MTSGCVESTQALQAPARGGTLSRDKEIKKLNEEIERLKKKLAGQRGSGIRIRIGFTNLSDDEKVWWTIKFLVMCL